jgi:predicted nucleic acid-binding Zn finger protein
MKTIWKRLEREKELTPLIRDDIIQIFGERGKKALIAVDRGNVKKYLDFFIVVGKSDEYIVEDDYCTCGDFIYRGGECWHILAVKIAAFTGNYEEYHLWYQETWKEPIS